MPTMIDPDPIAGTHDGIRRLHLHGVTVYACRYCRTPVRVVSAAYLPESCPACRRGTWTSEGHCSVTAACDAARPPDDRSHAHCSRCGESVWLRVETDSWGGM